MAIKRWWNTALASLGAMLLSATVYAQEAKLDVNVNTGANSPWFGQWYVWAIGSISYSAASDRIGRRKPLYVGGLMISLLLWAALIYVPHWSYLALCTLLCAIGFFP